MRWATPDGITVHTATLSQTPEPSRPGDPEHHWLPREYFVRTWYRGTDRWYSPTVEDLHDLAEREGWQAVKLAQMPEYAVTDTVDGTTRTRDDDGQMFTRQTAARWAADHNGGQPRRHRVYLLADVTEQVRHDYA
jgi:hypothetical protein